MTKAIENPSTSQTATSNKSQEKKAPTKAELQEAQTRYFQAMAHARQFGYAPRY